MTTLSTGLATSFITFSRPGASGGGATVTDRDGKIKWAGHNLLTNSESFDASSWLKYNCTVSANLEVSPIGTTTADRFNVAGVNAAVYVSNGVGAGQHTLSCFIKAGTATTASLAIALAGNGRTASFDLTAKTATASTVGTGGTVSGGTASIVDIGSGWFYCAFANVITTGANNPSVGFDAANGTNGFIWGAHLYRSDLGGMQLNPAQPAGMQSYYPTTPRNLLGYTEDFSNAAWVLAAGTRTSNSAISPNGLQTADAFVTAASSSNQNIYQLFSSSAGTHTFSIYAKSGAGGQALIQLLWGASKSTEYANFNLSAGSVVGGSYTSASCTAVGDGWFRCSITSAITAAAGGVNISMIGSASDARYPVYLGDGVKSIYLWGAQLSDSASLDTYVPVYGAAVTSAAYYAPRLDFDSSGVARGLLVEELRTNLLTFSNNFLNAAWVAVQNGVLVSNATIITELAAGTAPDGVSKSYRLNLSSTGSADVIRQTVSAANGSGAFSVYVKASATSPATNVRLTSNNTNNWSTGQSVSVTLTSSWQRVTLTGAHRSGAGSIFLMVGAATVSGTVDPACLGNVDIAFAQYEDTHSFATSYIPTGASTATRAADVASVSTQAFPYSSSEGTLVVNATSGGGQGYLGDVTRTAASLNNATTSTAIILDRSLTTTPRALYLVSGSSVADLAPTGTWANYQTAKIGTAYAANDFASSFNGGTVAVDPSGSVPLATVLQIGSYQSSSGTNVSGQWSGHIRQITYLPRRISNAELQQRTL